MKGYSTNIEKETLKNNDFRRVLYTAEHSQLVLMSLPPSSEIGAETHSSNDQFFRFEAGTGKAVIDGNEYTVADGSAAIVPAGARHNIINTSDTEDLKLYTLYSPPHHEDGTIHATSEAAAASKEHFDGETSE